MDCFVFWSTYRNAISQLRITFRYADSCSEGAMPRKGCPFTVDYCKKFTNLSSAISFISELNTNSPDYLSVIYGR